MNYAATRALATIRERFETLRVSHCDYRTGAALIALLCGQALPTLMCQLLGLYPKECEFLR